MAHPSLLFLLNMFLSVVSLAGAAMIGATAGILVGFLWEELMKAIFK